MADEESNHHPLIDSPSPSPPPPFGMSHQSTFSAVAAGNGSCGEIVEVKGGHIVRSTGRKDRHSKVCTAKGARDRRVRLSAPTAIKFYDVQDRLGFDRPSKAVDWLIKKAKSAIDDLAELPPWNPADTIRQAAANAKPRRTKTIIPQPATGIRGGYVSTRGSGEETEHRYHQSTFLPATMNSDSIADTIKSFFPVVSTEAHPPQIIQQNYHQSPSDFPLRANTQNQDLRLSLQSFQNGPPFANQTEHVLFSGQSNPLGFDSSTSWDQSQQNHHQSPEFGRIQRLVTWNNTGAADSTAANGGGFVFASPATTTSFQPGYGQSQLFSQRGPLQSINSPMIRAWFDPHHHHHHHHHHPSYHIPPASHQSAIPGIAFASSGELSGFRLPARFQGEQDHHGDKPSSDSRH